MSIRVATKTAGDPYGRLRPRIEGGSTYAQYITSMAIWYRIIKVLLVQVRL
jgi:hypothetical protein